MNKKYLYPLLGGFVLLVVLLMGVVFSQQSTSSKLQKTADTISPAEEQSLPVTRTRDTQTGNTAQQQADIVATPTIELLTPEQTVERFYSIYYTNGNPLTNGKFKTNKYLSNEFKDIIENLYNNGNKPVFCPQNQRTNIVVGKRQEVYNVDGYRTQVIIMENAPGNKDLYRVLLKNEGGQWVIYDINCARY